MSNKFKPDWVSPPGDTILNYLEESGETKEAFGLAMGLDMHKVEELLDGRYHINNKVAQQLAELFKISAQFWKNREKHYRQGLKRLGKTAGVN